MLAVMLYAHFQHSITILMLAYVRVAIVFYMLPILGERILTNLILKNTLIILTIIGLWPGIDPERYAQQGALQTIATECVIGLILAVILSLPFWVVIVVGEIIDNQRGATISDSIDPVNGAQSSILSGFFNFAFGAIFFAQNGMRLLMEAIAASYRVFPGGTAISKININEAGELLMILMQASIMLAAPIMIIMMLSEVLLGIVARYCPQLNSFSLSLTIKSSIAFVVFMFYGFRAFADKPLAMFSIIPFQHFFN